MFSCLRWPSAPPMISWDPLELKAIEVGLRYEFFSEKESVLRSEL